MYLSESKLADKLKILAEGAKYDVSCSSSGSKRKKDEQGLGSVAASGICHSWTADGRCISLLKILYSNDCIYDCVYCVNRSSADVERATFLAEELAELTIEFYRRNYIEGLFLSSAVFHNPDYTMENINKTLFLLREQYRFQGYIHVKVIPGADQALVLEAGRLADRLSVNIELPTEQSLNLLAPQKTKKAIIKPMGLIREGIAQYREDKRLRVKPPNFVPAGQSTQLMVGATPDSDSQILRLAQGLYDKFDMRRVYYSAYIPVNSHPNLPALVETPLQREHRLYQADWLIRFYGFNVNELFLSGMENLDNELDPKCAWAIANIDMFPLEVNRAAYELLLRVPGIGVKSAQKIVRARRLAKLSAEDLQKLGIVWKRAKYFLTCNGKYAGSRDFSAQTIRNSIVTESLFAKKMSKHETGNQQLVIF